MLTFIAIIQAIHLIALILMFGFVAFFLVVVKPLASNIIGGTGILKEFHSWSARWFSFAMLVAFISEIACFCAQTISISGLPFGRALSADTFEIVGTQTAFGRQCLLRLIVLMSAGGYLLLRARKGGRSSSVWMMLAAAVSTVLLFSVTLTSHAAAGSGVFKWALVAIYTAHIIASAIWLGGLVPFACTLENIRRNGCSCWTLSPKEVTQRFSAIALAAVGLLMITGLLNAWIFVGSFSALMTAPYGYLLILKLFLFAAMLGVAALNRFAITPQLEIPQFTLKRIYASKPLWRLYRNVILESGLGIAVILVAAFLGLSPPALH